VAKCCSTLRIENSAASRQRGMPTAIPGPPLPHRLCLAGAISRLYCLGSTGYLVGGVLSIPLLDFRTATAFAAVAVAIAGCAATNNVTTSQGEQPYKTGYGLTSDGPTSDLYTELFGSRKTATSPSTATTQQGQSATETASTRQPQPGTPTVSAQPRPPSSGTTQPPPEPDIPVAYGITANGPTTDLFTELFGPTRRDGQ
jgi:hypothetical protein